jgi:hypothetical protein
VTGVSTTRSDDPSRRATRNDDGRVRWALADRRPRAAHDRLQADAVFIDRPRFQQSHWDAPVAPRQPRPQVIFERRTILIARRFRMARLLDRMADGDQSVPPGLDPVKLGKAARNLRSRPKPAVISRRLDPLLESRQRLGCQRTST